MKISLSKVIFSVCVLLFVPMFVGLSQQKESKTAATKKALAKPTSLQEILDFHALYLGRVHNYPAGLTYQVTNNVPASLLRSVSGGTSKYLLAVFGLNGNKLVIHFIRSNPNGDGISSRRPSNYATVLSHYKQLKKALDKVTDRYPLGIPKFPLVIKMDTENLVRVADDTKGTFILFYPGIEKSDGKLTISAVASNDRVNPHPAHSSRLKADIAGEETDIPGEETWPDENFTYYDMPNPGMDIELPETR
jgi:hypothetical protein